MERRDQIVVAVARLVVLRRPPLQPCGQILRPQFLCCVPPRHLLNKVQQGAAIAISHAQQALPRLASQWKRALQLLFGALQKPLQGPPIQPVEHQHLRARQDSSVKLKARVLCCRPHQHDGAVFHMRQKPILLRFVKR